MLEQFKMNNTVTMVCGQVNLPIEIKDEFLEVSKGLGMKEFVTICQNLSHSLVQLSEHPVRFKEEEYQYSRNQPNAAEQPPVANERVGFDCKRYKAAVDGGSTNTRRFTPPLPTAIPTKTEVILKLID